MSANQTKSAVPTETAVNGLEILLYDLESSYNTIKAWGTYQQDAIRVVEHRQIISFAYKWLGEDEIKCFALPDFPGYKKDPKNNKALMEKLHALFMRADVTVGHNVEQFDDRRSFTDMIKHDLAPLPPHRRVDTLKFARHKFDFNSNRLDDLGEFLGLGRKVKHPGFEMWEGCMAGDPASWDLMKKYNVGDVVLLEKIYLKLRPWMHNHPNMNVVDLNQGCPRCRSKHFKISKNRVTRIGVRTQYLCFGCGHYFTATVVCPKGSAVRKINRFE